MARDGVDGAILVVLADAGAEHQSADERADAADHVDDRGTSEIMEAHLAEPAAAPGPMARDRIDDEADEQRIEAVRRELRALCHGTRNNRRGRRAEDRLEDDVGECRITSIRTRIEHLDEEIRRADDAADVIAEHQAEADNPERDGADAEIHEVLHDDVAGIFRTRQAGLDHREAWLHEEDECSAEENPDRVHTTVLSGVRRICREYVRHRGEHAREACGRRRAEHFHSA